MFLVNQSSPTLSHELLSVAPDQIGALTVSQDSRDIVFVRFVTEDDIWLATLRR
jgi:hypothetical protein